MSNGSSVRYKISEGGGLGPEWKAEVEARECGVDSAKKDFGVQASRRW